MYKNKIQKYKHFLFIRVHLFGGSDIECRSIVDSREFKHVNMSMTPVSNQPLPSSCRSNPQISSLVQGVLEALFWVGVAGWIVTPEGFQAVRSRLKQWWKSVLVVLNWSEAHKAAAVAWDTGNESLLPQTSPLRVKVKVPVSITSQGTGNLISTFNLLGSVELKNYWVIEAFVHPFKSLWYDLVRGQTHNFPVPGPTEPPTHLPKSCKRSKVSFTFSIHHQETLTSFCGLLFTRVCCNMWSFK